MVLVYVSHPAFFFVCQNDCTVLCVCVYICISLFRISLVETAASYYSQQSCLYLWAVMGNSRHRWWKTTHVSSLIRVCRVLQLTGMFLKLKINIFSCLCCANYMCIVFVWSTWNEMLIKVVHTEYRRVWFCPLPSTHTLTATLLIIRDKKCWLPITLGWACGMFEADTFCSPSRHKDTYLNQMWRAYNHYHDITSHW